MSLQMYLAKKVRPAANQHGKAHGLKGFHTAVDATPEVLQTIPGRVYGGCRGESRQTFKIIGLEDALLTLRIYGDNTSQIYALRLREAKAIRQVIARIESAGYRWV